MTDAADGGRRDSAAVGTASPPARVPATVLAEHQAAVAAISEAYAALPPGSPVRLAKRTSNLFRFRDPPPGRTPGNGTAAGGGAVLGTGRRPGDGTAAGNGMAAVARGLRAAGSQGRAPSSGTGGLDVSAFTRVLHVDPRARLAVVGGMTTYEDLADATLRHGLMPLVVPQLKTITLGGAVTGLGIESTSLRNGLPHESVTEMEILTGDGRVVTAAPGGGARRAVPRLPELLRHARLRPLPHDRAGAGPALRAPAALPFHQPGGVHGGRRPDRGGAQPGRAPGGLRRWDRLRPG